MKRITLITIATILAILLFGVSSFAANNIASDAVQGVRNVVGGAENVVGGAITGVTNGVRTGISGVENTAQNTGTTMTTTTNNNAGYNAARTATTRTANNTSGKFLGMGATAWGWFIMAVVGIITVALVWYYGKEHETRYNHNDDNY